MEGRLRYDGYFWRRLALLGAAKGPTWLLRYSPPLIALAAMALVPEARHAVQRNLTRVRGRRGPAADTVDTARTFAAYAASLAEALAAGSKNGVSFQSHTVDGKENMYAALDRDRGVIVASVHSGGWDVLGALFADRVRTQVTIVMEPERDPVARKFHDEVRERAGVKVAHAGDDPLAALPLLRALREKGIVALLCDRTPQGMKTFDVELFGAPGRIPQGPVRLAQLSGAPIVPLFCVRAAFRSYHVRVCEPIFVPRSADEATLQAAAQRVADAMTAFVTDYPTQWFHFHE
ncbi:MAG: lysophospholipid acyltransferase family protein [Myxococcales bacterium]|jgi:KDO2-lipid IV(A) lauroyltransferase|nr:lysophospholipid acyltransferase family protein [Myxococcales bacterium]MBL0196437.1 lysophospholipid acyltransferase family protein [Myxococcales bacterium]HQY63884.1 lysophospholipid acyltransferase family protein [Polyangiaceae bacterium]